MKRRVVNHKFDDVDTFWIPADHCNILIEASSQSYLLSYSHATIDDTIVLGDDMARRSITPCMVLLTPTSVICESLHKTILDINIWCGGTMSQSTIPDINVNIWSVWWHHLEVYLDLVVNVADMSPTCRKTRQISWKSCRNVICLDMLVKSRHFPY